MRGRAATGPRSLAWPIAQTVLSLGGRDSAESGRPGREPLARLRRSCRPLMILAIDQGTTGTTCLVVDEALRPLGRGYREIAQHFPRPGWVEHDPEEIWASVESAAAAARRGRGHRGAVSSPRSESRTNGRRRSSGSDAPGGRFTGPSCGKTAVPPSVAGELPAELIRERTGLVPDPYFSATKLEWILEHTELPQSQLAFGTVDTWLIWKLTGGAVHVTDVTNASRTMLLDLATGQWDDELLTLFSLEPSILPTVVGSSGVVAEASLLGVTSAGRRDCRRPAGGALRPGLFPAGGRKGDVRDRHVRARQPRRARQRVSRRAS